MQENTKRNWNKPELTVHGSVEDVTANKAWGFSDTFIIIIPLPIKDRPGGGGTGS